MNLSPQEIKVLLLRFREHHSLLETAQAMGVPITVVLSLTDSAFEKLEMRAVAA